MGASQLCVISNRVRGTPLPDRWEATVRGRAVWEPQGFQLDEWILEGEGRNVFSWCVKSEVLVGIYEALRNLTQILQSPPKRLRGHEKCGSG